MSEKIDIEKENQNGPNINNLYYYNTNSNNNNKKVLLNYFNFREGFPGNK